MRTGKGMKMNSMSKSKKEWEFFKSNLLRLLVEYIFVFLTASVIRILKDLK